MENALLIWDEIAKNENGFPVHLKKCCEVYAEEKTVKRAEFYEAMRAGISVTIVLEIRLEDWEMSAHLVDGKKEYARKVKYDGCEYNIIRGYKSGKATIELTCG